jgi:protein-L-isoaspartate(D-aspartate) O-methyltransferase
MGVERLLADLRRHIADERVLAAIRDVPRERYVAPALRSEAWENVALPIDCGQTISQPLVVARMCELLRLRGDETVLDVGTGSGYHAAVLSRLVRHVYSIEVVAELSRAAGEALAADGVGNVTLVVGDGSRGLPEHAPYDAVNVAAATGSGTVPEALVEQLAEGGRLVAPVGDAEQRLVRLRRTARGVESEALEGVRFVPLVRGGG